MNKKKYKIKKNKKRIKKIRKNSSRSIINKYNKRKSIINKLENIENIIKDIDNQKEKLEIKQHNNFKMISIFILLLSFLTGFTLVFINYPFIEINGKKTITLEYQEEYKDEGATAVKLFNNISDKLIIFNNVDPTKTGTYSVVYAYQYLGFQIKKTRTVKVVDRTKPEINLKGPEEVKICPNKKYVEEGYEAHDEYDGNITDKVIITKQEDRIIYEIEDSSGNKNIKSRKITKLDTEKPQIVLNGTKIIYLTKGTSYNEPGYKATDNCDDNITNKVIINNPVNTNQLGTYNIEYKVTDSSNNTTIETRTVQVIEKKNNTSYNNQLSNSKSVIYLTFDDGPSNSITPKVLDILKSEDVKATFFVIFNCNNFDNLIRREYNEGHTVALHSYTHEYNTIYKSADNYFNDLNKIRNKVYKITGEYSNIIRFPGGSSNTISKKHSLGIMSLLTSQVRNQGYHYFDWNISSGDAGEVKSSKEVYNNVINNLIPNRSNVILMHDFDNNYYTLNALQDIIKYGKENGYTFSKITMDTPEIHHKVAN